MAVVAAWTAKDPKFQLINEVEVWLGHVTLRDMSLVASFTILLRDQIDGFHYGSPSVSPKVTN
jgi:hypothetical protein